jgi:hypothetical protein
VSNPARIPVVFVAGSGHSGSTLLALLLDAHPEIACVGETAVKPRIRRRGDAAGAVCSCGAKVQDCPFWTTVFRKVQAQGLTFSATEWTNDYRFEQPLLQRLLHRACRSATGRRALSVAASYAPLYSSRVARIDEVNQAFMRAVLEASSARVFADTTKVMARLLHLVRIPSLDIRVVALCRDVRGYAASAKKRGISPLDATGTWMTDQAMLLDFAREHPKVPYMSLRYEELCERPSQVLASLWDFCGVTRLDLPEPLQTADHHVLGNNMRMAGGIRIRQDSSWRDRLNTADETAILRQAGQLLSRLGYDAGGPDRLGVRR